MKSRGLLIFGAGSGVFSVIFGAFASHGLKSVLSPYLLGVFETGVHYQFIHTLSVLCCAIMLCLLKNSDENKASKYFSRAAICFMIGIFCFSGSLYLLALTGVKWFGPVTPFGGLCFIVGWIMMMVAAWNMKEVSS
ncbi:hypothetical protein VA7868_02195 [Vibrio aerogenes CECT 7868]|uniref:Inner membrane protein YgdD n=1 Tax=Vibrio aerogenes CECT 7868 TaxID=1216006 RepID=A0A1M5Z1S2_9VIBR|nr:DUF423 domain-containing protein [Vibrio aerogenes]SHI18217.1 hypothetical protein VA7868_02195 [Vibrio aerogenes CECT 7868]